MLTGGDDCNKVTNEICDYLNYSQYFENKIVCNFIVGPHIKFN